jgi:hypothetical protein
VQRKVTGLNLGEATVQRQFQNVKCEDSKFLEPISSKVDSRSATQKIPRLLWYPTVYHCSYGPIYKDTINLSKITLAQCSVPCYTTQESHSYGTIRARPVIHASCQSHFLNIVSCESCVLKMRQTNESTPLPIFNKKMGHRNLNGE